MLVRVNPSTKDFGMGESFLDKLKSEAVSEVTSSVVKGAGLEKSASEATTAAKDVAEKGIVTAKEVSEKALVVLDKGLDLAKQVAIGLAALTVVIIIYKFYARSKTKTLNANVAYLELKP